MCSCDSWIISSQAPPSVTGCGMVGNRGLS
nr:MAG TPA: hypothetical protein [Caudoviricetes sp.]